MAISINGRGRCLDNVFVERLWRTEKQEDIYLRGYETVSALRAGLVKFFTYYNDARSHQSLNYNGPMGYRALLDYRPDMPPPLSAGQERPAMGVIAHRSNKSAVLRDLPEVKLFPRFQYHPKEFIGTLKGLARFAKRRRLVATPETSAIQCYEIEMEFDERTTVYSLDPQKNFSVRHIHNSQWNPKTKKTATGIYNVLKFQDFGSGIFLPTAI